MKDTTICRQWPKIVDFYILNLYRCIIEFQILLICPVLGIKYLHTEMVNKPDQDKWWPFTSAGVGFAWLAVWHMVADYRQFVEQVAAWLDI